MPMDEATLEFLEEMGRHFEEEGAPRIAGRLFGLLLVSDGPCSLDEIAGLLRASKASASTNARLLERIGVAQRVTRPGDRRDFYEVADDMGERMLVLAVERLRTMTERLRRGAATLPISPRVRERFTGSIRFHERVLETVEEVLLRIRSRDHDEHGRPRAPEAR
jgi:DNA-binding MarR family transcriptional regulator